MRKRMLILVLWLGLAAKLACAQDKWADLAIVVNPACSIDNISSVELAKIFKAERSRNPDGAKYLLAARETDSPERNAALGEIYQMTDADYQKYFLQATFAGKIQTAPKVLLNAGSMIQFIMSAPGAIGYLRASDAVSSVKILRIDGKVPGEPGYPIKIKSRREQT
jgi:hypothetical protein